METSANTFHIDMRHYQKLLPKIVILLFAFSLIFTDTTDADFIDKKVVHSNKLAAATLDFSERNTVDNSPIKNIFDIQNFQPDGFQVSSLRINNEGDINFRYSLQSVYTSGNMDFCNALNLKILVNGETKYQNNLMNLNLELNNSGKDDLIFILSFNQNDPKYQNQTCEFNWLIKGRSNKNNSSGFVDQKHLSNRIVSGIW